MKVHVPESVDEAVGLLGAGTVIAGGTHVVPRAAPTESLVSLRRAGLAGITVQDRTVRIGAATTLAQVGREVEFLHAAIESIASPTIRNLATVGGNLFVPQPHGDLAVCLLALDARVSIIDSGGARDVQFADGQWVRAKSLDTFCPLGSELVQVEDPQSLKLTTKVNGELVQDSNTSEMIFGVAELISFCSHSFTLEAGDVILTGTPWGCGEFMDPKRSLKDGDVVECEVEGVGVLRNPVVEV